MSTCDLLEIGLKGMRARTMQETAEERDQGGPAGRKWKGNFSCTEIQINPVDWQAVKLKNIPYCNPPPHLYHEDTDREICNRVIALLEQRLQFTAEDFTVKVCH